MSFPERYDIDWRHKLDIHDRGVLKPIMEENLVRVTNSLAHAIYASTKPKAFWPERAYILARRVHRYARILEVIS